MRSIGGVEMKIEQAIGLVRQLLHDTSISEIKKEAIQVLLEENARFSRGDNNNDNN
jgi:hypothetical protein